MEPTRPGRRLSQLADGGLAGVVLVANAAALVIWRRGAGAGASAEDLVLVGTLAGLGSLPLIWRRQRPAVVFALVSGAFLGYQPLSSAIPPFGYLVALYSASVYGARVRPWAVAAVASAGVASAAAYAAWFSDRTSLTDVVSFALLTLAIAAVGYAVGGRRSYTRALEERAALLEQQRATEAARAAAEERTRIAREMHDVVAHHVSLIVVQAGGAGRVVDSQPDHARESLANIERAGREALGELRRILGVLRTPDTGSERSPQPSIQQLEQLVSDTKAAGLDVELRVSGEPRELPAGICLTIYRVAQEALTNVVKHAGDARAHVELRYRSDGVELEVSDDGRGRIDAAVGSGHGLVGMRERIAAHGGAFHAGPRVGGGFTIRASIPMEAS